MKTLVPVLHHDHGGRLEWKREDANQALLLQKLRGTVGDGGDQVADPDDGQDFEWLHG
jgi:hypothetical protein